MEYLIVSRAGEIFKLRFDYHPVDGERDEQLFLSMTAPGQFYPIHGYSATRALAWLEERGFECYWERDGDDHG